MRGDRYEEYARQLRRDEYGRMFRYLVAAVVRMWHGVKNRAGNQVRGNTLLQRLDL